MENKRIGFIDISRAIAIILIVVGHTLVHSEHCSLIFKYIYSFHVVLFFVISGYVYNANKKNSFFYFVKDKFKKILIPYFIWALLFLIPYMLIGKEVTTDLSIASSSYSIDRMFINVFIGNGNMLALKQNSSLWFLPALFTIQVLYYYIIKLVNKKSNLKIPILILLIITGYVFYKFNTIVFPFGINTFFEIGVFYYIGYLIRSYDLLNNKKIFNVIVLFICLVFGSLACFFNSTIGPIDYYYGNYFLALISGFFLSFTILIISKKIDNNKVLEYIGKNTLGILIFHKIIVVIFQTKLGFVSKLLINSNIIYELLITILVCMLSIMISLVITKIIIYIFPPLIGKKYEHNGLINNIKNRRKLYEKN